MPPLTDASQAGPITFCIMPAVEEHNIAVKFFVRDERNRARREFNALVALESCMSDMAPRLLFLDGESYAQPVVVQSWLEGEVSPVRPQTDDKWRKLIHHYATLATVVPENLKVNLEMAVMHMSSLQDGLDHIQWQLDRIPKFRRPAILDNLFLSLPTSQPLNFPKEVPVALCRVDSNILNIIRRPGV